jgi:hypothetical protein
MAIRPASQPFDTDDIRFIAAANRTFSRADGWPVSSSNLLLTWSTGVVGWRRTLDLAPGEFRAGYGTSPCGAAKKLSRFFAGHAAVHEAAAGGFGSVFPRQGARSTTHHPDHLSPILPVRTGRISIE